MSSRQPAAIDEPTRKPRFVCDDCRPLRKNSLRAFVRIQQPSGQIVSDIAVHEQGAKRWASPPGRKLVDKDTGQPVVGKNGRAVWVSYVDFTTRELRDRWSASVVEAVADAFPETFAGEG